MSASIGTNRVSTPREKMVLSRDLADFLIAFSGAFQRYSMYPESHPSLDDAVRNLHHKLEILFLERAGVTVGATPNQLIVCGVPTDPDHALLRDLAGHLHGHGIGGLKLLRGVKRTELDGLLARIARNGTDAPGENGSGRVAKRFWPHLRLYPLNYDQLELVEEGEEEEAQELIAEAGDAWAHRLWLGLARAALGDEQVPDDAAADPLEVAIAIDVHAYDPEYDRRIIASLTDFAEACRGKGRSESVAVQRHLARLIAALSPKTLRRLLAMRGDGALQRHFLLEVSHVMAANVVLQLVEAAAQASERSIAPGLLQLLGKLALHAENGPSSRRVWADDAFREMIRDLVQRWEHHEPTAGAAQLPAGLEHISRTVPAAEDAVRAYAPEPERILLMSLEGSFLEPGTLRAVDWMIAKGHTWKLLDVLQMVPPVDPVGRELKARVYDPHTVSVLLSLAPIDVRTLDRLVPACGTGAIAPMLDALAAEKDRRVRSKLLDLVGRFGPAVGPEAVARIRDAPWYVQRNMLKLLGNLPALPREFSATAYMSHSDPRVRIESLKLLLKDPSTRDRALKDALRSPDPATLRLGLVAAVEGFPRDVLPIIVERLEGQTIPGELRSMALRAIAPVQEAEVFQCLWKECVRRRWIFGVRLAPKSPDMLTALAGLSTHWRDHPRVAALIEAGATHRDREIRESAGALRLLMGPQPTALPRVLM